MGVAGGGAALGPGRNDLGQPVQEAFLNLSK